MQSSKLKIHNVKLDPIEARLNRAEGQIKAIKRMYDQGAACSDVVQQVQAVRSALGKIAGLLLTGEVKRCAEMGDVDELEKIVDRTFKTL